MLTNVGTLAFAASPHYPEVSRFSLDPHSLFRDAYFVKFCCKVAARYVKVCGRILSALLVGIKPQTLARSLPWGSSNLGPKVTQAPVARVGYALARSDLFSE